MVGKLARGNSRSNRKLKKKNYRNAIIQEEFYQQEDVGGGDSYSFDRRILPSRRRALLPGVSITIFITKLI
jgi:hypothetical protein